MSLFQNANRLFGTHIEPSCSYCKHGERTQDGTMILCEKQGVVSPFYSCRKFDYAPLKRVPKRRAALEKFDKEDFSL